MIVIARHDSIRCVQCTVRLVYSVQLKGKLVSDGGWGPVSRVEPAECSVQQLCTVYCHHLDKHNGCVVSYFLHRIRSATLTLHTELAGWESRLMITICLPASRDSYIVCLDFPVSSTHCIVPTGQSGMF